MRNPAHACRIRLVLIDDHDLVRAGFKALLETEVTVEVVGEARDGIEGLKLVHELKPTVLLLDLELKGLHGLDVLRRVPPECPTIILSAHSADHYLAQALEYGAVGYVLKDSSASELLEAIRTVTSGDIFVSPSLRSHALEASLKRSGMGVAHGERLTERERQVLRMAACGKTSIEIASTLSISRRTAEAHRAHLMKKLTLKTQTDLVRYALRTNIISV